MLVKLKDGSEFAKILSENKIVVADFNAKWCGPCRMFAPVFDEVAEKTNDIAFVPVDVDDFQRLSAQYAISSVPTIILFKDGQVFKKVSGFMPEESFVAFINQAR